MNNVHDSHPILFESRWTLSFLRGPMTRVQIKSLTQRRTAAPAGQSSERAPQPPPITAKLSQRPVLPPEVPQKFIPAGGPTSGITYRPCLFAVADVRFTETKSKLDLQKQAVVLTPIHDDASPSSGSKAPK